MNLKLKAVTIFILVLALSIISCGGNGDTPILPVYTLTYDGNTNTGGTVPVDTKTYSTTFTVTVLGKGTLTKESFTFTCWNTQADGNGTDRAPGSTFAMGTASVTLYAKWTALPTYTVTYAANTGSGDVPVDSNNYLDGATVTVLSRGTLAKYGHTFTCWNTQADGNGTDLAPSSTFTIGPSNITLYAKWTANPTYTVTYDANTGSGSVPTDSNNYLEGATVTVLGNATLTKTCHTFSGWNTQADGNGTDRAPASTFAIGTTDVTLYAKWTAEPIYTWYRDRDSDGYGDGSTTFESCTQPTGYVSVSGDCNDSSASIHPGATEIPADGIDQNCDVYEACYRDLDHDGQGTSVIITSNDLDCIDVGESTTKYDCNDSDNTMYIGATELCDGKDNDCDGVIDEGCVGECLIGQTSSCPNQTGVCAGSTRSCGSNGAWIACDYGPMVEICGDGLDNDCDGSVDETPCTPP